MPHPDRLIRAAAGRMSSRASKSAPLATSGGWGWFQASRTDNVVRSSRGNPAAAAPAASAPAPAPSLFASHAHPRRDARAAAPASSSFDGCGNGSGWTSRWSPYSTYGTPFTNRNISSSSSSSGGKRRDGNQGSAHNNAKPRFGLLLREYMHRCLYDRSDGYFAQSEAPVGQIGASINFNNLLGQEEYARVLEARYARLASQW